MRKPARPGLRVRRGHPTQRRCRGAAWPARQRSVAGSPEIELRSSLDVAALRRLERRRDVPPEGAAALTRRIKAAGDFFAVAEKRGRKVFSRGIWTAAATVERVREALEAERSTESFAKRKEADSRRREKAQVSYVEDFHGAVLAFL